MLHRRGPHDSTKLLNKQAAQAEEKLGIHGVSVTTSPKPNPRKPDQVIRCATCSEVEAAGFKVHKTGGEGHYTVELPKPVTKEVADQFNSVFK